jgi:sensor domain CHASE-containing protein
VAREMMKKINNVAPEMVVERVDPLSRSETAL